MAINVSMWKICNDPRSIGFNTAVGPIGEFESKIASKILNNAHSWIGLNNSHIKMLQNFQDEFTKGENEMHVMAR